MNRESQFRISNLALTVACILCGITAAVWLMPQFGLIRRPHEPSVVAANLKQLNYSEFQANPRHNDAPNLQGKAAPRPTLSPESSTNVRTSIPVVLAEIQTTIPNHVGQIASTTTQGFVKSTSFERNVSQRPLPAESVPHFYAPVTVHPVTVNIDNSGVIREISRVHERLDSLSNETRSAEPFQPTDYGAIRETPVRPIDVPPTTRRFEYKVHDEHPKEISNNKCMDQVEMQDSTAEPEFVPQPKPGPTRIPTSNSVFRDEAASDDAPATKSFEPLAMTPEPMIISPLPEAMPEPTQEFNFEIVPQEQIPVIPDAELPAVELQTEELDSFPAIESSTELIPIPDQINDRELILVYEESIESAASATTVVMERTAICAPVNSDKLARSPAIATSVEAFSIPDQTNDRELILAYEESIESAASTPTVVMERTAFFEPMTHVYPPETPVVSAHLASRDDSTKRTTDPPFMNGRRPCDSRPIMQTKAESFSHVAQTSHQTHAVEPHSPQPVCRNCNQLRSTKNPTYRIQAVAPPETLQRIASFFR